MLVKGVEDVTYDELGEIELAKRRNQTLQGSGDQRRQRTGTAI